MINRIRELSSIILYCDNVLALQRFYTDIMEFPIYNQSIDHVELRMGSTLLALHPYENNDSKASPIYLAFRVAPDDVYDIESYLIDKGVTILMPVTDNDSGRRSLLFTDLEGNHLEIYADIAIPKNDSLLSKLTFEQVLEISEHCELQTYSAGQSIVNQGDLADKFYVITQGHVKVVNVTDDKEILIGYLHTGDYFGEVGLLQSHPRTATIRASDTEEVHVIAINREGFGELIQESEVASADISQAMYDRLMEMAETIIRTTNI